MSNPVKTNAILLDTRVYRGSSIICFFYTEALGRISALCYGAKKENGKFGSDLTTLAILEVVLEQSSRSDMYTLKSTSVVEDFSRIQRALIGAPASAYILECVSRSTVEHDVHVNFINMVSKALGALARFDEQTEKIERVLRAFEIKLLYVLGVYPEMYSCAVCANEITASARYSLSQSAIVCQACASADSYEMIFTIPMREGIEALRRTPFKNAADVEIDALTFIRIKRMITETLYTYFGRVPKSVRVLEDLVSDSKE